MKANKTNELLIAALLIACCLSFTSCTGKNQEAPIQETPAQENVVQELSGEEVYQKIEPSTVEIVAEGKDFTSTGSGFYIDENGTVVTNYHVISKCNSASVNTNDGGNYLVEKVLGYNKDLDIAILSTSRKNCVPVELSTEAVTTGETVYALGSSIGFLTGTFSEGIVSSAERVLDGMTYIQITTPVSHGNSGGPLVNKKGCVVGIICAGFESGQNLNLALPISLLAKVSTDRPLTMSDFYTESIDGVLKVAIETNFYPYSFEENGTFYGLHVDMANCLAEKLGWEIEFVPTDYKGLSTKVTSGVCDIAFGIESFWHGLDEMDKQPLRQTKRYYKDLVAVISKDNKHVDKISNAFSNLFSDGTIDSLIKDYQKYIDNRISRVAVRTVSFTKELNAQLFILAWDSAGNTEQALIDQMDNVAPKQGGGKLHIVEPGDFVEEIDKWLFAYNRHVGDVEVIKNPYGYSVVYVSAIE